MRGANCRVCAWKQKKYAMSDRRVRYHFYYFSRCRKGFYNALSEDVNSIILYNFLHWSTFFQGFFRIISYILNRIN